MNSNETLRRQTPLTDEEALARKAENIVSSLKTVPVSPGMALEHLVVLAEGDPKLVRKVQQLIGDNCLLTDEQIEQMLGDDPYTLSMLPPANRNV